MIEIKPKYGVGELLFGMKQKDVTAILGLANKEFDDEEGNKILTYNNSKLRLTFYEDEDFKLGYIIGSHDDLMLSGQKVIGRIASDVINELGPTYKSWEQEDFDLAENHFNEAHWLILQTEFGVISKVEIGATINDKDEFDWKFKNK